MSLLARSEGKARALSAAGSRRAFYSAIREASPESPKCPFSPNTGNLSLRCPFDSFRFGGGDDGDDRLRGAVWSLVGGAFEGPVSHFAFDDAGVGPSPPWWQ
jgi:hypothetical protein